MAQVDNIIGYVKGPQGDAASIAVGNVTTGDPGTNASVTNSGTSSAAVLNFQIPKGAKGDAGTPGVTDYATTSAAGLVRVGDDFNINTNTGVLSIKDAFTEASTLANINTGESHATILGKIKKFMTTLMPSNFLINTVNSTATDKALTANMGKKIAGDIATVQTSATASKAYSVGEYLVLNGQLYRVTSAIANGGTITPGTNVSSTTVGAQISLLNDNLTQTRALVMGGVLPDGADLNDVVTPGYYSLPTARTYTNVPPGAVYSLAVYRHSAAGEAVLQVAWHTNRFYFRFRISSTTWQTHWRVVESTEAS